MLVPFFCAHYAAAERVAGGSVVKSNHHFGGYQPPAAKGMTPFRPVGIAPSL